MPPNTNLFTGVYSRLPPPPPHKAHSYIQTAWGEGERGSSKGEREREQQTTGWLKQNSIHPTGPCVRCSLPSRSTKAWTTVHPSRLLLMTWVSKNLQLLSHTVRIRVTATMLVTRLKRRRCNRFLRQQSHTLRRRTLRGRPSLRCVAPAT